MAGILYLCATPIGNLEDMTYRCVRILKEADLIAAEDTRNSIKLLNHFEIDTPMTSYHEFNKIEKAHTLLHALKEGKNVALITDAGTPGISDPGEELVAMCYEEGIEVNAVPGAAACITAVTSSGQACRRFSFEAFLPKDKKERARVLEELAQETLTMIVYEAPHHLRATLQELFLALGDRSITLCRELTKRGVEVIGLDRKSGTEATKVCELLKNGGIDCVFHLAAQTSVFNGNLEQIRKDNIDTFMRVADACNQNHVKLIYASSSTANPENTTSMYGISKYFDEQYASIYCKAATGCRLHNVYGPNPRKRTLLWFLMEKENVSLYNCGQNIRCFTYIDDVIEGLIYSVGCNRQLINICNVQPVTTMYFASLVKYYKPLEIELINEKRDFDNLEQSVNRDIYLVPLSYTSVEDGVKKIFDERKGKDMSY